MRLSASLTTNHPGIEARLAVRHCVERVAAANRVGLDAVFVGDHHVSPTPYLQNTPLLGRLLAEWDDRPAGCLFLLPLWNPVLVAEQIGTLAAITSGRFILQTGLGHGERDFIAMGANIKHRPSAFEQSLDIIRRLLTGETVTSTGRFNVEGARISPIPSEPVEVWIGASADVGIDRAGRLGDGWLGAPYLTLPQATAQARRYHDAVAQAGANSTATALRRDVFVAGSDTEAAHVRESVLASGYRGISGDALVIGTVGQVSEELRAFGEAGYTDIVIRHAIADQTMVLASYERLREVRRNISGI